MPFYRHNFSFTTPLYSCTKHCVGSAKSEDSKLVNFCFHHTLMFRRWHTLARGWSFGDWGVARRVHYHRVCKGMWLGCRRGKSGHSNMNFTGLDSDGVCDWLEVACTRWERVSFTHFLWLFPQSFHPAPKNASNGSLVQVRSLLHASFYLYDDLLS